MIKVVVFDLWNTLVYNPIRIKEEILKILPLKSEYVQKKLKEWNCEKISNKEFFNQLTNDKKIIKKLLIKWEEINKNAIVFDEVFEVFEDLKKDTKITLLSNSTHNSLNILYKKNLLRFFDKIYLSCDYGLTKPDIKFFKIILNDFNIDPKECMMVGDNEEVDIIPAKEIGIITVLLDREKVKSHIYSDFMINNLKEIRGIIKRTI